MSYPNLTEAGHGVAASLFFSLLIFLFIPDGGRLAHAGAYVPDDDSIVLERLRPARDPVARELEAMAEAVRSDPGSFPLAAKLVRRYVELARAEGDPRFAGYAEAALEPWVDMGRRFPDALFLRATLRQYRHDFDGALGDLDRVIEKRPENAEALLARATIHQVRADYDNARRDCAALAGLTAILIERTCSAVVNSLTGNAETAYETLRRIIDVSRDATPPHLASWSLQTLGEIAARLGDVTRAEEHYRAAADLGGSNLHLTCALFDLLLDDGRAAEARAALGEDRRPDILLLRHAQAAKILDHPDFEDLTETLERRFAEYALRGDERHLREEARFRLLLDSQADRALDLALRNWRSQRETSDARLVLEAALAAGQAEAAMPIVDWVRRTGLKDAALSPLVVNVEEASP